MDKKLLIGVSICAVVLLVLGSLSNVVGYQSVESSVNDSPLISIRTNKATKNENNRAYTSNYLGKSFRTLSFASRENKTALIQMFVDRIRTMDDNTFNRFIDYTLDQITHKDNFEFVNAEEFIKRMRQIRESTQDFTLYKDSNIDDMTIFRHWISTWFPGYLLFMVFWVIINFLNSQIPDWYPGYLLLVLFGVIIYTFLTWLIPDWYIGYFLIALFWALLAFLVWLDENGWRLESFVETVSME